MNQTYRRALLVLVCIVASLLNGAVLVAQQSTAIVNARVIDGRGGVPIANGVVVVRGDRIVAVGAASAVTVPPGAQVIDVRGKTVMPGLADMHVHLLGGWDGINSDMLGFQRYLNALLYAGVTTVLDAGNALPYISQMRQEVVAGRIAGPKIFMSGPLIDGPNAFWPHLSMPVSSSAQIPRYVKQLKTARADVVKAYSGLTNDQVAEVVAAAAAESLPVFADVFLRNGTAPVAQLGIGAFAHLGTVPATDETITVMREKQVATITTLAVEESFSRRRLRDLRFLEEPLVANTMPPWFVADLKAYAAEKTAVSDSATIFRAEFRLRAAKSNAKLLSDAGILLVAGTDSPYPGAYFGESLHRELELLVEAGLTPLQAISAATSNAAQLMKQAAEWGTLEVGKRADVLIINGDPSARISDTRRIDMVMQSGRVLNRESLTFNAATDPGFRVNGKGSPNE